jgi:glycosyltransferase involved in cell wall biosynthesis
MKLLFDPLISQWDTVVCDRKLAKAWSIRALRSWIADYLGFHLPDCVLCDTEEHKHFYREAFGLNPRKSLVVPVGVEESLFFPPSARAAARISSHKAIQVLYYGGFSPLHGVDLIVRAALALEGKSFEFTFVGVGPDREKCEQLARNLGVQRVRWIDYVPYRSLGSFIREFDIGLGLFGCTAKARRVIPNKVYQMIACGLPVLTLDTPAIQEAFEDGAGVVLVQARTVAAVSEGLLRLSSADARKQVAELGLKILMDKASESVLAEILASALI